MQERLSPQNPKSLNLHPEIISDILEPKFEKMPMLIDGKDSILMDPNFPFDSELLDKRLASIPIQGINTKDTRTVMGQILDRQNKLAFDEGIEGAVREIFTPEEQKSRPFESKHAKYQGPGEIWVLTANHLKVKNNVRDKESIDAVEYGFMPLEDALRSVEMEYERQSMLTDYTPTFEIKQVRILPDTMSKYSRALQKATKNGIYSIDLEDITNFRNDYFEMEPGDPDMTKVFRSIKQEYLGDTTWKDILYLQLMMRAIDLGIGYIPGVNVIKDSLQAITGKEFIPGIEGLSRKEYMKKNIPLPEKMYDMPLKGRLLEIAGSLISLTALVLPPAWAAKVPIDSILEGIVFLDKMEKSRKYIGPFLEISELTGTKPEVIEKVQNLGNATKEIIKSGWEKILKPLFSKKQ
jgi:hypothetical protein